MSNEETAAVEKNEACSAVCAPKTREVVVEPAGDVYQDEHGVRVLLDVPGVKADGVSVDVADGVLRIQGRANRGDVVRRYERAFRIGRRIDPAGVEADLNQGVLTLRLPYHEEVKPRKIEVKAN